jgi:hypothetical protein
MKIELKLTQEGVSFSGEVPEGFQEAFLDSLKLLDGPLVGYVGARGILFGALYLLTCEFELEDLELSLSYPEGDGTRVLKSGYSSGVIP